MKNVFSIALFLVTASLGTAQASPEHVEFCKMESDLLRAAGSREKADSVLRAYLADKQIVYVEGLLGSTRTAFRDNQKAIHELDATVPITKLAPPSKNTVEENAMHLVFDIARESVAHPGRKIILMGMSKGGAEVLQTAVRDPRIFNDVDVVVPMNAAIGGAILADLELYTNAELTKRWETYLAANNLTPGFLTDKLARLAKYFLLDTGSAGFRSMSTKESILRNEALHSKAKHAPGLDSKIQFVTTHRTATDRTDSPSFMSIVSDFLNLDGVANDGILFEKDQALEGVGTHLLSIAGASHFNLTGTYGKAECRADFTRYLIYKLATRNTKEIQ